MPIGSYRLVSLTRDSSYTLINISSRFLFNSLHPCVSLIVSGVGYSWTFVNSIGLWTMAIHGSPIRDCSDFHSCRFLLLLCQEVG